MIYMVHAPSMPNVSLLRAALLATPAPDTHAQPNHDKQGRKYHGLSWHSIATAAPKAARCGACPEVCPKGRLITNAPTKARYDCASSNTVLSILPINVPPGAANSAASEIDLPRGHIQRHPPWAGDDIPSDKRPARLDDNECASIHPRWAAITETPEQRNILFTDSAQSSTMTPSRALSAMPCIAVACRVSPTTSRQCERRPRLGRTVSSPLGGKVASTATFKYMPAPSQMWQIMANIRQLVSLVRITWGASERCWA